MAVFASFARLAREAGTEALLASNRRRQIAVMARMRFGPEGVILDSLRLCVGRRWLQVLDGMRLKAAMATRILR